MKTDWRNYCAVCERIHVPTVDCQGRPVDWAARKVRARAWLAENGNKPAHKRAGYDYGEGEHPCTTS